MTAFTHISRLARACILAMCAAGMALGSAAGAEERDSVVVVTSRDDGPYEGVVAGVREALGGGSGAPKYLS